MSPAGFCWGFSSCNKHKEFHFVPHISIAGTRYLFTVTQITCAFLSRFLWANLFTLRSLRPILLIYSANETNLFCVRLHKNNIQCNVFNFTTRMPYIRKLCMVKSSQMSNVSDLLWQMTLDIFVFFHFSHFCQATTDKKSRSCINPGHNFNL